MHSQQLIDRLTNGTATIGVVGLGYVGLPLVLRYCEKGYKTIGFDVDARKVEKLAKAQSYIEHISGKDIAAANEAGSSIPHFFLWTQQAPALVKDTRDRGRAPSRRA